MREPIQDLDLSVRTINTLTRNLGISDADALTKAYKNGDRETRLAKEKTMGPRRAKHAFKQIQEVLESLNYIKGSTTMKNVKIPANVALALKLKTGKTKVKSKSDLMTEDDIYELSHSLIIFCIGNKKRGLSTFKKQENKVMDVKNDGEDIDHPHFQKVFSKYNRQLRKLLTNMQKDFAG